MKRILIMLIGLLALAGVVQAQEVNPTITSFTTSNSFVNRSELINRTARVPVSWTTQNRIIGSNLVFEQVLPSGGYINVELPRVIPWVSSNGDGIAAPVLPAENATEVVLRVRLINIFDSREYDVRTITVPIRNDNNDSSGGNAPRIVNFAVENHVLDRQSLLDGTERVRVRWESVNRPVAATLVFEQVFSDGTFANVELPRDNPWVNPSDSGVVAPFSNNPNVSNVTLRLRMVNILNGFTYDQRTVTLSASGSVGNTSPQITAFSVDATSVNADALENRGVTLPVSWIVENRPNNSNLVFEQVMPGDSVLNVELPRDFTIIPSSGNGYVRPYPVENATELVLQLRVVNLRSGQALVQEQVKIPVNRNDDPDYVVVSGNACYSYPFPQSTGVIVGSDVQTTTALQLKAISGPDTTTLRTISANTLLDVTSGPYCYRPFSGQGDVSYRQWQVTTADNVTGWIQEYSGVYSNITRNIIAIAEDDGGGDDGGDDTTTTITTFNINPNPAKRFDSVTVNWDVNGEYGSIDVGWYPSQLWLGDTYRESLYTGKSASGNVQVELDSMQVDDVRFVIDVFEADGALAASQEVLLDLSCAASLVFTDPENASECALPELQVNAAFQTFDGGFMLWREDKAWIIVGYNDGTYRIYNDLWNGQEYAIGEAPEGKIAPARGFGYVWINNPELQERLGWATGSETSFTMKTQQLDKRGNKGEIIGEWYYALPDARVMRTQYGTTGTWKQL